MSEPPNTEQAKAVIEDFARQMLSLTEGKPIPRGWKSHLLKALAPSKKPRGGKPNLNQMKSITVDIIAQREALLGDDRTIGDGRKNKLTDVAAHESVSTRTVERVREKIAEYLKTWTLADEDKKKAVMEGIGEQIAREIRQELETELTRKQEAHLKEIRRKYGATEKP